MEKFIKDDFYDLPWHDTEVKQLLIDRSEAGEKDEIKLMVSWPDATKYQWIVFKDCYAFEASMNFGIIALETVLKAGCLIDSAKLREIKSKWKNIGVNLRNLRCYHIVLNSTASDLKIYALNFRIEEI